MARSSEDVLLQMGEVRYKKGDGTLYVMSERLAWIADNCDTVAVSHRFAEIKCKYNGMHFNFHLDVIICGIDLFLESSSKDFAGWQT